MEEKIKRRMPADNTRWLCEASSGIGAMAAVAPQKMEKIYNNKTCCAFRKTLKKDCSYD